jgi:hypothetical protein
VATHHLTGGRKLNPANPGRTLFLRPSSSRRSTTDADDPHDKTAEHIESLGTDFHLFLTRLSAGKTILRLPFVPLSASRDLSSVSLTFHPPTKQLRLGKEKDLVFAARFSLYLTLVRHFAFNLR